MVRRAKSARTEEKANLEKITDPSSGGAKPQQDSLSSPGNLYPSPNGMEPPTETHISSGRKSAKKHGGDSIVRRSQRIQNVVMSIETMTIDPTEDRAIQPSEDQTIQRSEKQSIQPDENQTIQRVIEEITFSQSENEDGQHHKEVDADVPDKATMAANDKSLEDRMDYLFELTRKQQKIIEDLEYKVENHSVLIGNSPPADVRYQAMYMDSQKRIKALKKENHQVSMKLENALGKLSVYENGFGKVAECCSEIMEKVKDVMLVSNLTRATDFMVNLSAEAARGAKSSNLEVKKSTPKRKRTEKPKNN